MSYVQFPELGILLTDDGNADDAVELRAAKGNRAAGSAVSVIQTFEDLLESLKLFAAFRTDGEMLLYSTQTLGD